MSSYLYRRMILCIVICCSGIIPRSWRRYIVPAGLTVIQWVTDFSERIKQLQNVSKQVASGGSKVLKVRYVSSTFWGGGGGGIID